MRQVGKRYLLNYSDLISDEEGWVKAEIALPSNFDILSLKIKRNGKEIQRIFQGWWTGHSWDGKEIKKSDKVIYWKKLPEP